MLIFYFFLVGGLNNVGTLILEEIPKCQTDVCMSVEEAYMHVKMRKIGV